MTPYQLAGLIVSAARDKKAWKPVRLNVQKLTTLADYFVVCEGETDRQVRAICDHVIAVAKAQGHRATNVDGYDEGAWVVIDFDSVLVHVLLPGERAFYDLESLWRSPRTQQVVESRGA